MGKRLKPKIGTRYGFYEVISDEVFMVKNKNNNHHRGHLHVKCTICDTTHYIRADILKSKQATKCRACSNKEKYHANVKNKLIAHKGYSVKHFGTGELSKSHLCAIRNRAKYRNLEWDDDYMTTENLWNLALKQDLKCVYTKIPLTFNRGTNKPMMDKNRNLNYDGWNASLDRIDSSKGYVKGNVQWVDRRINIMKLNHTHDDFIKLCKLVTKHANQQPS